MLQNPPISAHQPATDGSCFSGLRLVEIVSTATGWGGAFLAGVLLLFQATAAGVSRARRRRCNVSPFHTVEDFRPRP